MLHHLKNLAISTVARLFFYLFLYAILPGLTRINPDYVGKNGQKVGKK